MGDSNNTSDIQDISAFRKQRMRMAVKLRPAAYDVDEMETQQLAAVDSTQLPTQIQIPAVSAMFPSTFPVLNGISVTEYETWVLPAIPGPKKTEGKGQAGSTAQDSLPFIFDLIKSSGIYAVAAFISPLVSLVLTPFLTRYLSNTNYGSLSVLSTVVDLVTVITQLGLAASFFRTYNGDYEATRDRLGVLAASIIVSVLVSIPVAGAVILTAPWLSVFFFNSQAFDGPVRVTALVIMLENLSLPAILWLRVEKRAIFYSTLSIVNLFLSLSASIVLVGVLHLGVSGALLAKGVGDAVTIICTYPLMLFLLVRQRCLHLRLDVVRNLLSFGIPTIFSSIASWILQLSDRYLLSRFGSLSQTASYTIGYTLGGVLSALVISPFILAWNPLVYIIAKRKDAAHLFLLVFRWFSLVLLFATFAFSLLSIVVLKVLFPPSYQSAASMIPIIALSIMFVGVYYVFVVGVNIRRKAGLIVVFMSSAAVVNVLLNIFLIPLWGAMGAAVSTLVAYVVLILITYIVSQRIYPVKFEVGRFIIRLFVGIGLYAGSSVLAHSQKTVISWGVSIGALALYGIFLMVHAGLSIKNLQKTFGYLQKTLRKKKVEA